MSAHAMPRCPFVWYELMTTDTAAAARFYGAVVGWTVSPAGPSAPHYGLLCSHVAPAAGLMAIPPVAAAQGAQPGWLGYIGVPRLDDALARLDADGGHRIEGPLAVDGVGRMACVSDPQGAMFMLMEPAPGCTPPPVPAGTVGHVAWHELATRRHGPAQDFYARHFGWRAGRTIDLGTLGSYQLFAVDDAPCGGMMDTPPGVALPVWTYYVRVEAVAAATARITAHGGRVTHGPMPVPGGEWVVQARDPQGAAFALVGPRDAG